MINISVLHSYKYDHYYKNNNDAYKDVAKSFFVSESVNNNHLISNKFGIIPTE